MNGPDGPPPPLLSIRDLHVTVAGRHAAQPVLHMAYDGRTANRGAAI